MNTKKMIGGVIVIIAIIAAVIYRRATYTPPPATNQSTQSTPNVINVGKVKTLYRFSDYWDKIVRVNIQSDAEFYPKGGVIKITAPSGKFWLDEPGTAIVRPTENPGEFVFEIPKGSKAWGVEIWN